MIRRLVCITAFSFLSASVANAQDSDVLISDAISLQTGSMSYNQTGLDPKAGSNVSNVTLEWAHFAKRDLSPYVGYRIAFDGERGRTLYQAGYAGYRYYYLGLGTPVKSYRQGSTITYDFSFRPYAEASVALGRYLIGTFAEFDAFDLSSDFYGVGVGAGFVYAVGSRYGIDVKALYEYVLGYGPLDFGATNLFVLLGMNYYI